MGGVLQVKAPISTAPAGRQSTGQHRRKATVICTTGVDDYSRVVYSEILDDERKHTAAGFWTRAAAFFDSLGVTVEAVMTDNGACYRSNAFNNALGGDIKHRFTRAYRPQTNGKVERFNRTLMSEWAYARPYLSEATVNLPGELTPR